MKSILILAFLCGSLLLNAQEKRPMHPQVFFSKAIDIADLKKHLTILASDEYEGRETGKKGQKMAAQYIANHFKNIGLKPGFNDTSYFQPFPLVEEGWGKNKLTISGSAYNFLEDYYGYSRSNITSNIIGEEIIFLGYGIEDEQYNDYKGVDVKDKIIIILPSEPLAKDSTSLITNSKELSKWSLSWRDKLTAAKKHGVKAILVVDANLNRNLERQRHYIESTSMRLANTNTDFPYVTNFYISEKIADQLLAIKGYTLNEAKTKILQKQKPLAINIATPISIESEKISTQVTGENVLGLIEGTDLKDEIIVITAHYDHIGMSNGKVYNGADDDGSGTVAIMEIAEAFMQAKKNNNAPRRSILFMAIAGEEKGLLGSKYYSDHPVYPLDKTIANLNIDMIGRIDDRHKTDTNYVYIIGSDMLSTELHEINERANESFVNLELDYTYNSENDPNRFYYRSDHYNFAKKGIPIIFYFNGVHEDYHKEGDEVHKIHFPMLQKRAHLVFYTAWELANKRERIKVDKK